MRKPSLEARVRGETIILQCGLCEQLWAALENHRAVMRKVLQAVTGDQGLIYLVSEDITDERVAPVAAVMREVREVVFGPPFEAAADDE